MIFGTTSEDMRDKAIRAYEAALREDEQELSKLLEYADPCPFCESPELNLLQEAVTEKWYIYCDNCGACGPIASRQNFAVSLWNVRKQEPEQDPTTV